MRKAIVTATAALVALYAYGLAAQQTTSTPQPAPGPAQVQTVKGTDFNATVHGGGTLHCTRFSVPSGGVCVSCEGPFFETGKDTDAHKPAVHTVSCFSPQRPGL